MPPSSSSRFGVYWFLQPPAPSWWPVDDKWWLFGGWPPGITLVLSGMFAIGLIVYSYRRFRGSPYEEDVVTRPVAVIIAAGPGVSGSLSRRMAREGYDLALVGHEEQALQTLTGELEELGASVSHAVADVTDVDAATDAVRRLAEGFGRVDWLHFNPSAFRQKDPLSLTAAELLTDVGLGVAALLTALQAVRPFLQPGARVTATGSMAADKPWNEAASLGVQKAGLRNLVRSIDTTLEPRGHPRRLADGARHAGQGRSVHPRPGGRRDLGRRPPGRVRLAHRGALQRLTPDPSGAWTIGLARRWATRCWGSTPLSSVGATGRTGADGTARRRLHHGAGEQGRTQRQQIEVDHDRREARQRSVPVPASST